MIENYPDEEWKEIEFPQGNANLRYAVSNVGRLMSFSNRMQDGTLLGGSTIGGYKALKVNLNGKEKTFYVHKLVAAHFLPNPHEDQRFVTHLDYIKKNNHVRNLRWVSRKELISHQEHNPRVIEGKEKQKQQRPQVGHKLTSTDVMRIKKMIFDPNRKTRMKVIAKQFGISEMQLYRIKSGENWSHIKINE